jgi:hypothetical protein
MIAVMPDRIDELAMRRRQLLLRSERLRADLAADQRVVVETLSGVDRAIGTARRLAPFLLAGGGVLLLTLLRGRRRAGPRPVGFAMRSLALIALARRALTVLTLVRAVARSRRGHTEAPP